MQKDVVYEPRGLHHSLKADLQIRETEKGPVLLFWKLKECSVRRGWGIEEGSEQNIRCHGNYFSCRSDENLNRADMTQFAF